MFGMEDSCGALEIIAIGLFFVPFKIARCGLTQFYLDFVDQKRHVQCHVEISLIQKFRISYNCSAQNAVDLHRKKEWS